MLGILDRKGFAPIMKKFTCLPAGKILPIILSFFINLFLLFIFVPSALAVNISGDWVSREGGKVEAKQSGSTFTLTITDSRLSEYVGFVGLKGTITGNTFNGQQYYITDECPNLTGYVPAWGTISDEKIEAKATGFSFDPDTCNKLSNSEFDSTYTKTTTPSPTPQSKQSNPKDDEIKPANQNNSNKDGNPFNIFAFNPLETWRNIQGLLDIPQGWDDLVGTGEFLFAPDILPDVVSESSISNYIDSQGMPLNFLPGYIPHESIEPDSTVRVTERTRLSNKNSQTYFELRPGQGNQAVLKIPGEKEKSLPFLGDGEIEVVKNKSGASDSSYNGIKTPNGTVLSVQTHYLVSYDKKNNQTTVIIYDGKVEVKTNDGKTTIISPDGDQPGVVIIAQKLSITKLVLVGLVLLAIIIGAIFFIKRKGKKVSVRRR